MIKNSIYYSPTKMYFGEGEENNIGNIINEYGYKNILIIYGKSSVVKSGLLDKITNQLVNVSYKLKGGVEPNPKVSFVVEANEEFKNENFDLILAVGGGSVIDTAKGIAATFNGQLDPIKVLKREIEIKKFIPVATVLTLSASGSEFSSSCVLSELSIGMKQGMTHDSLRPVFSIMNPTLTCSVSKFQTANGIVDIMMHTLERYFDPIYSFDFTNELSIGLIKTVYENGKKAIENPNDYEARANLMICGAFSHNDLTNIGITRNLRVHVLEHAVSALKDEVSHGEGLAVLFIAWAKVMKEYHKIKMAPLAQRLFNVDSKLSIDEQADLFISKLQEFFISIGMSSKLSQLNFIESDLEVLTNMATKDNTRPISDAKPLDNDLVYKIYKEAF
ncbi:MAG: iron-containing alcohol dehydrogenase [bacterium]